MSHEKRNILYLDDEENNLLSFKAMFRREFNIFTATTAQEAVAILNEYSIPVILSDQKMPEISGVEFFELILPDFPDTIRILVTGYADIEAVIDAINKGQVYRYVTKPWNEADLRITINNALDLYDSKNEIKSKTLRLEQTNNELEKFVYSASHDLRAPLVSLKGIFQLIRTEELSPKVDDYLKMAELSTNKLDAFLQNIIHYYQNLKSDELVGEIDLPLFIESTVNKLKSTTGADEVEFNVEISTSGIFKNDEHRLRMIVSNLILNAIRFRDVTKDRCIVDIQCVQNSGKLVLKVSDNGLGIEEHLLPHIFNMSNRSLHSNVGTGIGLYIVREATNRLNGKITVHSQLNEGTKFTVEVPNHS